MGDEYNFDLLVLNAAFLRDHDWHWAWHVLERVKYGGKVAYVEGWDSAHEVHNPWTESNPPFPVTTIFRREIDPDFRYPYQCYHLDFASPARWFDETERLGLERNIGVYFSGTLHSNPFRLPIAQEAIKVAGKYWFVLAADHPFDTKENQRLMRRSKIVLSPPGAADCNSTGRLFEILACGAIPVCVNYLERVHEPELRCYFTDIPKLISTIDLALYDGWEQRRQQIFDHARQHHTTRARAERLLRLTMG